MKRIVFVLFCISVCLTFQGSTTVAINKNTRFTLTARNDYGIAVARTTVDVIVTPVINWFLSSHIVYESGKPRAKNVHTGQEVRLNWFISPANAQANASI